MKGRGRWSLSGPSSEFIIKKHDTFLIFSIRGKPSAEVSHLSSWTLSERKVVMLGGTVCVGWCDRKRNEHLQLQSWVVANSDKTIKSYTPVPLCYQRAYHFMSSLRRVVRLLHPRRLCRQKPHCKVEETRVWKPLLFALHPDPRYQLRDQLHLSSAQEQAGSGKKTLLKDIHTHTPLASKQLLQFCSHLVLLARIHVAFGKVTCKGIKGAGLACRMCYLVSRLF